MKPKILLIPSHHGFYEAEAGPILARGIEFKEEMLEWSLFDADDEAWTKVYYNALKALYELPMVNSVVSIYANPDDGKLCLRKRTWGRIYHQDQCVAWFSHDTRKDNSPFYDLWEWPEVDNVELVKSWTSNDWKSFFLSRIRRNMNKQVEEATLQVENGLREKFLAQEVLEILGP
jgi:hypothetical protein